MKPILLIKGEFTDRNVNELFDLIDKKGISDDYHVLGVYAPIQIPEFEVLSVDESDRKLDLDEIKQYVWMINKNKTNRIVSARIVSEIRGKKKSKSVFGINRHGEVAGKFSKKDGHEMKEGQLVLVNDYDLDNPHQTLSIYSNKNKS